MALENLVVVCGRMGATPPTIRQVQTQKGQTLVANFSFCWSQTVFNKESGQPESRNTTWIPVEAWGKVAEQVQQLDLQRGQAVLVVGRLGAGTAKTQGGEAYRELRLIAREVYQPVNLPNKSIGQAMQQAQQQPQQAQPVQPSQQFSGWNAPAQPGRPPF